MRVYRVVWYPRGKGEGGGLSVVRDDENVVDSIIFFYVRLSVPKVTR